MSRRRYYYDAKGNLKGFSSSTRRVTIKGVFLTMAAVAVIHSCGVFDTENAKGKKNAERAFEENCAKGKPMENNVICLDLKD